MGRNRPSVATALGVEDIKAKAVSFKLLELISSKK